MVVRDMCLAVYAQITSVCIDHCNSIKQAVHIFFIKADRDDNRQFLCQCRKMFYRIIFIHFFCKFIVFISAFLAKILSFKKFRQKDDLCSFFCRFPDKRICLCDIFFHMCAAFHLNCGYCDVTFSAHNCAISLSSFFKIKLVSDTLLSHL